MEPPVIVATRPRELEADVVKFQNNREKWIAFVGLLNGRPYEIFTGLADDDEGIMLPKNVSKGSIIKSYDEDSQKHYDFQFKNKRGYKMTIEGLDGKFNPEFWNYAKLISGVLRYGMPIDQVIKLVQGMERIYQHLEERCGTRFEEIPAERYGGKRPEMPELRT